MPYWSGAPGARSSSPGESLEHAAAIGVVAIGRNEGSRLEACLRSLPPRRDVAVVYVDSGSQDQSPDLARRLGAQVVELDESLPFTAARARNAGFQALARERPDLDRVQFVDGDCELEPGWLDAAAAHLAAHPEVAVVCGRRREIDPGASLYNRLADIEWDRPAGEVASCGGDALMRAAAFAAVDGYDASLIAGEDPDLCLRLRRAGWRVVRLDLPMTRHDARLASFGQWWRRQVRSGHAFAEAVRRHRGAPDPHRVRRLRSILLWGAVVPIASLGAALATGGPGIVGLAALALPWVLAYRDTRRLRSRADAMLYATACAVGKLAEAQGAARFAWNRLVLRRSTRLIEYKGPRASCG